MGTRSPYPRHIELNITKYIESADSSKGIWLPKSHLQFNFVKHQHGVNRVVTVPTYLASLIICLDTDSVVDPEPVEPGTFSRIRIRKKSFRIRATPDPK